MRKISKTQIKRDNLASAIYTAISDKENGGRNASVIINILANGEFDEAKAKAKRISDGEATEKQRSACFRLFWSRHYSEFTYAYVLAAVKSEKVMQSYRRVIRRKSALVFVNATPPDRMQAMFGNVPTEEEKQIIKDVF